MMMMMISRWRRRLQCRAIAKHARVVLTVFCQCSGFIVSGITEI